MLIKEQKSHGYEVYTLGHKGKAVGNALALVSINNPRGRSFQDWDLLVGLVTSLGIAGPAEDAAVNGFA